MQAVFFHPAAISYRNRAIITIMPIATMLFTIATQSFLVFGQSEINEEGSRWFMMLVKWVAANIPALQALMILSVIDVVSGTLVAFDKKMLNSSTSFRGMSKKAMMFILIGTSIVIEQLMDGAIPISKPTALAFCVTELKSIIENAGALGVPLPKAMLDAFEKLREGKESKIIQKKAADPIDPSNPKK